jgi:hypothetical protein
MFDDKYIMHIYALEDESLIEVVAIWKLIVDISESSSELK